MRLPLDNGIMVVGNVKYRGVFYGGIKQEHN